MAASVIDSVLQHNCIANGLSGPVFQAAIEYRGVFANKIDTNGNVINTKAGAMYMYTGRTVEVKDKVLNKVSGKVEVLTYNVPEVIAVDGPDNPPKNGSSDYKISITFNDNGQVKSAKLVV